MELSVGSFCRGAATSATEQTLSVTTNASLMSYLVNFLVSVLVQFVGFIENDQ